MWTCLSIPKTGIRSNGLFDKIEKLASICRSDQEARALLEGAHRLGAIGCRRSPDPPFPIPYPEGIDRMGHDPLAPAPGGAGMGQ
ncbi:hypothetical protein ABS772_14170 [Methylorubrum podarium]|uniref:Uncharacterized protein n=1 Tax=Methylorubrum podarium TaxID=200476 RepID=A0ABV1QNW0_9HYPH